MKVLFVCLGNICRSPAAEGVFLHMLREKGLEKDFVVDSAGTSGHHQGEKADPRMIQHAAARGISLPSVSRQFLASDFDKFDWIIVMDDSNYKNCLRLASTEAHKEKLLKMADFTPNYTDGEIPDPYFGGAKGFETVLDMVEEGCANLLKKFNG